VRSLFHVSTKSKVAVKVLVGKYCIPMSAFALFSSRECSFLEVQFDKRLPQREAEHDRFHIERSTTPGCGRSAFGLAKNSATWVCCDFILHDIFSSCDLMRFFTVEHHVCYCGLLASSRQFKTISWSWPP